MIHKIAVIGTGYVGLVTGTCLSEFGLRVACMDVDESKIHGLRDGVIPIYEPGLDELVAKNVQGGRLSFTTSMEEAVDGTSAVFLAVGTPPSEDGSADLSYVIAAAQEVARVMDGYRVIVDKSTVPVGTGQKVSAVIREVLKSRGVDYPFDVVSNPEFLREGAAVRDFMCPDRIVIGAESERAKEVMRDVYRVLWEERVPFLLTDLETAELIKYASNAFLAVKITFINELASLSEAVGADVNALSLGMGLDSRIGRSFLRPGPGYGGSCFPKDTKALAEMGRRSHVPVTVVEAVIQANKAQKLRMVDKIIGAMGDVSGKTVAILGLSFKPETDDMRESPAITILRELARRGAAIRAFDPVAMANARETAFLELPVYYADDEYDAVAGADALVIVTEWRRFAAMDLARLKELMAGRFFFDLRNMFQRKTLEEAGFIYFGVGR